MSALTTCIRTNSANDHFRKLVSLLDVELSRLDGDEHSFYAQFNKIDKIRHAIVAYKIETPVGCGAIKEQAPDIMEVKRMYVVGNRRGQGIASTILSQLEQWATELGYERCRLETGKRQPEAIELYKKNGYTIIPNFGQYEGIENSVCFEKVLPIQAP